MSTVATAGDGSATRGFAWVSPVIGLAVMTVIAILPVGLPNSLRFVPPMLPLAVVYYWALNGRGWMPAPLVAAVGLFIDLVTYGPLGFWSLTFLLGQLLAHWLSGWPARTRLLRLLGFALAIAVISTVQWLTASIYFVHLADWRPFAYAAVSVMFTYPLVSLLFAPRAE
jgi:rod shape-determining protein MreD